MKSSFSKLVVIFIAAITGTHLYHTHKILNSILDGDFANDQDVENVVGYMNSNEDTDTLLSETMTKQTMMEEKIKAMEKDKNDQKGQVGHKSVKEELVQLMQSQKDCSKVTDKNRSKFRMICPCNDQTSPEYARNMVEYYGNDPLFQKCLNSKLRFDKNDPLECWPRIFLQVSFPTSGCKLSRYLSMISTKRNQNLSHYNEGMGLPLYSINITKHEQIKEVTVSCRKKPVSIVDEATLPIAMMGKAALFKTHMPRNWGKGKHPFYQDESVPGNYVHGILHLTRNPGDHIFRDLIRWTPPCHYEDLERRSEKQAEECKRIIAKKYCRKVPEQAQSWVEWHTYWFDVYKEKNIPHFFHAYENFSNLKYATFVMDKLMNFLNETSLLRDGEIENVVKEPSYEHGTVLLDFCGKNMVLRVHNITKDVSSKLGYEFDMDRGTWSMPAPF